MPNTITPTWMPAACAMPPMSSDPIGDVPPIDFRKVEIVNLMGCMDPKDPGYRPYFVKSDPAACKKK